ncbi:phosphotransferase system phosphocarrier protein HPr [Clostridium aceticum]|uniref:Phosphotransferase system phosphocarrier protein HPr n=1 Tax=Clostridium aceticum TaxID=84022 RepID=A0A0D8IDG6_9CLOT|nr:HPr family phosphocarrier protein [Clostridium aceticum]AKL94444.1 phosphotransferase system phosphocarrier protein HPr [Clostridium aceticum]KJF28335.1 serine kinase [Clostridium aceticum]
MLEKLVMVKNKSGIHARPAGKLVKEASKFKSDIFIVKSDSEFNAKSIMNVMSMGAKMGENVLIKVSGEDEKEAFDAIIDLIERGFDDFDE